MTKEIANVGLGWVRTQFTEIFEQHNEERCKMIDIVQRLRFDAIRCEAQFSKGVAGNLTEGADEIERLRGVLEKIKGGRSDDPQLDAIRALDRF